jgi:hypothetical protein
MTISDKCRTLMASPCETRAVNSAVHRSKFGLRLLGWAVFLLAFYGLAIGWPHWTAASVATAGLLLTLVGRQRSWVTRILYIAIPSLVVLVQPLGGIAHALPGVLVLVIPVLGELDRQRAERNKPLEFPYAD